MSNGSDLPPNLEKWVRSDITSFVGYSPSKALDTLTTKTPPLNGHILKLDANENPYGCSPRVTKALAHYKEFHIYPDAIQTKLRQQLQNYTGIDAKNIVADNGSGELLDNILRLFVEPGDKVINCVPTFDMFRFRTLIQRGIPINVPRREDFSIDVATVKRFIDGSTKLIIIANPNNPTGTIITKADILELADLGIPLLVDEAYFEFYGETIAPLVDRYQNIMVLRTFSKWAGLAGLRVGYGIFPAKIADYILKIKPPYNVNVAALIAVRESLIDIDHLQNTVNAIITERERLFTELSNLEFLKPFPSSTNFILSDVQDILAQSLHQQLQDRGILVRYFNQPQLTNSIRISVGKPRHTDILISTLREIGERNG